MNLEKAIGRYLLNIEAGEAAAIGRAGIFAESELLTPSEQRYARDVMIWDEIRHRQITAVLGEKFFGGPMPKTAAMAMMERNSALLPMLESKNRLIVALADLRWIEPALLRIIRRTKPALNDYPDIVKLLETIDEDERGHTAYTKQIAERLEKDEPELFRRFFHLYGLSAIIYRQLMDHERRTASLT